MILAFWALFCSFVLSMFDHTSWAQPKLNENQAPFLHCILSFEGTSYKHLWERYQFFYFLLFSIGFDTLVDIIYYKFLELDSAISGKMLLSQISNRFTQIHAQI